MRRATVETRFAHAVSGVLLWAALLSVAFPLAWILLTSFKPVSKIYQMPPVLFFKPTLRNYYKALGACASNIRIVVQENAAA